MNNDTEYGLSAGIITADEYRAMAMAYHLEQVCVTLIAPRLMMKPMFLLGDQKQVVKAVTAVSGH